MNTDNRSELMRGNQHAAKTPEDKAESHIHARCKQSDKAAWVKAAQASNMKLTEWIIYTLNNKINGK